MGKQILIIQGGCGDTNSPPQIGKTGHLERAYAFGQELYSAELTQKN